MEKKVALITGASGSIGKDISLFLAEKGIQVVGTYYKNNEEIKNLKHENLSWIKLNLLEENSVKQCVDEIVAKHGRLDFLVNNAGIKSDGFFENLGLEDFRKVIDVNLIGTILLTKECIELIKESKGRIINISSVSGEVGNIGQTNYSASKAGLIGFTKSLAKEMARYGVTVNTVSPGAIDSEMIDSLSDTVKDRLLSFIPLKKLGTPRSISELIYFLLSNEENYITGQVCRIDGGLAI